MLDRIVVIQQQNLCEFFYVPPPSNFHTFMDRVVREINASQEYNQEIINIKKMLECECEKAKRNQCGNVSPEQAQQVIKNFIETHPLDTRTTRDVLIEAGAVELKTRTHRKRFDYSLYKR